MNDEEPLTIQIAPIKTEEEIACLYRDWYGDPIWDLENTEGFEAHHERLLQMRLEQEARWKTAREQREAEQRRLIEEYAGNHKCSFEVAENFLAMNQQIMDLNKQIDSLSERLDVELGLLRRRLNQE